MDVVDCVLLNGLFQVDHLCVACRCFNGLMACFVDHPVIDHQVALLVSEKMELREQVERQQDTSARTRKERFYLHGEFGSGFVIFVVIYL